MKNIIILCLLEKIYNIYGRYALRDTQCSASSYLFTMGLITDKDNNNNKMAKCSLRTYFIFEM